jgi:hypothetical protein
VQSVREAVGGVEGVFAKWRRDHGEAGDFSMMIEKLVTHSHPKHKTDTHSKTHTLELNAYRSALGTSKLKSEIKRGI